MLEVDMLTLEGLYPAVVIGVGVPFVDNALRAIPSPANVLAIQHQCGGLGCSQAAFVGLVVPLKLNAPAAADVLWQLFDTLGDQRRRKGALRMICPGFDRLLTSGEEYPAETLDELSNFVRAQCPLPRFVAGKEALVELDDAETGTSFLGWKCLRLSRSTDPQEYPAEALNVAGAAYVAVDGDSLAAVASTVGVLASSWRAGLEPSQRYPGRSALVDQGTRAFLIWQNSD